MLTVSKRPECFLEARHFHNECGPYQLQAALRAFGKDVPIAELYAAPFYRERDWSLPWHVPTILRRHGLSATIGFWLRSSFSERLADRLDRDWPALFVIRSIQGNGCLHWLSAWGHDAHEFLCYDSQASTACNAPGNIRYSKTMLEKALPWRGTFAITFGG